MKSSNDDPESTRNIEVNNAKRNLEELMLRYRFLCSKNNTTKNNSEIALIKRQIVFYLTALKNINNPVTGVIPVMEEKPVVQNSRKRKIVPTFIRKQKVEPSLA